MDDSDLERAEQELGSLLHKCEAVDLDALSPSRRTLMTNRVEALRTALALVARWSPTAHDPSTLRFQGRST